MHAILVTFFLFAAASSAGSCGNDNLNDNAVAKGNKRLKIRGEGLKIPPSCNYAPGYGMPCSWYPDTEQAAKCSKGCNTTFDKCRTQLSPGRAQCAANYAECLGQNPFSDDGTNTLAPAPPGSSAAASSSPPAAPGSCRSSSAAPPPPPAPTPAPPPATPATPAAPPPAPPAPPAAPTSAGCGSGASSAKTSPMSSAMSTAMTSAKTTMMQTAPASTTSVVAYKGSGNKAVAGTGFAVGIAGLALLM